jgi:cbb3-type cytochrome oxidase cytochrome c subunit
MERKRLSLILTVLIGVILAFVVASKPNGAKLFSEYGCINCHTFKNRGGKVGPDLSDLFERHNKEWVRKQIINPRIHNPKSIMPTHSYLKNGEIEAIIDYLSTGI